MSALREDLAKINNFNLGLAGDAIQDTEAITLVDAIKIVTEALTEKIKNLTEASRWESYQEIPNKTKAIRIEYFERYRELVAEIFREKNLSIVGYEKARDEAIFQCTCYTPPGMGAVEKYIRHPERYENIHINKWDTIFVDLRGEKKTIQLEQGFLNEKMFEDFCSKLAGFAKKEINTGVSKYIDFEVYHDRYSMIATGLCISGYSCSIRIHPEETVTYQDISNGHQLPAEAAEEEQYLMRNGCNIAFIGPTGSGKTTYFNALLNETFKGTTTKVLTCEDTPEFNLEIPNLVPLVCSAKTKNTDEKNYTLRDLIFIALRQQPGTIAIGEGRDDVFIDYVEAMETGHPSHISGHGLDEKAFVNRVVEKYIMNCPNVSTAQIEKKLGELHIVISLLRYVPRRGRRLISRSELCWDNEHEKLIYNRIWEYKSDTDTWQRVGKYSAELGYRLSISDPDFYEDPHRVALFQLEEGIDHVH